MQSEVGAFFQNTQSGVPMRVALAELGHNQPETPLIKDNSTAFGIINETIEQKTGKGHGHDISLANIQSPPKKLTYTGEQVNIILVIIITT
jgi:hypothetical protein